jgi:D-alanyl-D-alanine carboxypeptidase (penicillin-binding protein 5/6)
MRSGVIVVLLLVVAFVVVQLVRPIPAPVVAAQVPPAARQAGQLRVAWPQQGQSALAIEGIGEIAQSPGPETPVAIASLAKMMTAFLVLKAHPLGPGANGPTITFNAADVALYRSALAQQQSVVPVQAGERMSERQALEALLIPSANNVAVKLAQWVAGSQSNFVRMMNQEARKLGMTHTHYTDASGVAASTVSTAHDQLIMAQEDMKNPIFRQIVSMPQVYLPVAGLQYNVDYDLGKNGIVGIKTGSTGAAGGCFVFAGYKTVGGRQALIIGDVMGQPDLNNLGIIQTALNAGSRLLSSARTILTTHTWVQAGQHVAAIRAAWTKPVPLTAESEVTTLSWPGLTAHYRVVAAKLGKTVSAGSHPATLDVTVGRSVYRLRLKAARSINAPTINWRLSHL